MSSGPVLYDVAGPAERRRSRIISVVLTVLVLGAAAVAVSRLAANGVFDERWRVLWDVPMNFAGYETKHVWQAVFRGLGATLLAAVIALVKNTSVAGAFSVLELFAMSRRLTNVHSGDVLGILAGVALCYLIICIPLGRLAAGIERKVAFAR